MMEILTSLKTRGQIGSAKSIELSSSVFTELMREWSKRILPLFKPVSSTDSNRVESTPHTEFSVRVSSSMNWNFESVSFRIVVKWFFSARSRDLSGLARKNIQSMFDISTIPEVEIFSPDRLRLVSVRFWRLLGFNLIRLKTKGSLFLEKSSSANSLKFSQ